MKTPILMIRLVTLASLCGLLSACLGGTVAQQIARSIVTNVADKSVARALDVDEDQITSNRKPNIAEAPKPPVQKLAIAPNTPAKMPDVDRYTRAFMTSGFETIKAIPEPLPENLNIETDIEIIKSKPLVRVELFNLLIGDEKTAVFERARYIGAPDLPRMREWPYWQVATGVVLNSNQKDRKLITFLIPPEFGKMPSGSLAMVELAGPGELNFARYKAN
jgi:hypothetical protein